VFLNAFLTAAFAIFVRANSNTGLGMGGAFLAGLLLAVASLYKQVVMAQAALLGVAYVLSVTNQSRKRAIVDLMIMAAVGVLTWALVFGYFAARGHAGAFVEAAFTYNRWYSGNLWRNLCQISSWPNVSPDVLAVTISMATISLVGLVIGMIVGPRQPWILWSAFALATHIAILLPGRFFPHYYQLWLPVLAIGTGWTGAALKRKLPSRLSGLSYGIAGAAAATLILLEAPYYELPAESWSIKKYGNIFVETDQLAGKIDKLLPPGASFYEWGNESGFYFATGRRPPSGIVFAYPMLAGPVAKTLSLRLVDDLEKNKPELVVADAETLAHTASEHPVLKWFEKNYQPLSRTNRFLLFGRKGGKVAASIITAN
jgi:hypothetical protein